MFESWRAHLGRRLGGDFAGFEQLTWLEDLVECGFIASQYLGVEVGTSLLRGPFTGCTVKGNAIRGIVGEGHFDAVIEGRRCLDIALEHATECQCESLFTPPHVG